MIEQILRDSSLPYYLGMIAVLVVGIIGVAAISIVVGRM